MMRLRAIRRPGALLLAGGLFLFSFAAIVAAHAELEDATPKANAEVEGTPPFISGVYSESMDPGGSSLKLVDANDKVIATGGVSPDDDKRMVIDPVPELAPGDYVVQSTTKSAADGDIDRTTWRFTVLVAAVTPEPTATATATPAATAPAAPSASPVASSTAAATAAATPSGDGGSPTSAGGDVLLPILAAVLIVVVIGGVLFRRRDRSTPTQP